MLTRQNFQHACTPDNHTHVIKVGGENASDIRTAEWLATQSQNGERIAVAISALRTKPLNTTSELMHARDVFSESGMRGALPILENLFQVHLETLQNAGMHDNELEGKLRNLFEQYFPRDLEFPEAYLKQHPDHASEQRFIGYGEVMSANVLSHILDTRYHVANTIIDHSIRTESRGRDLSSILRDEVGIRVENGLQNGLVIVPGYVGVFGNSILEVYGRGYTDKIAERIAVGLSDLGHSSILHIQKQVPLFSSNPENLPNAQPIENLSYWSAAEITGARGANARVLNEHTVSHELAERNIPVWVYNPFEISSRKSVISESGNSDSGILFVDGRDHVSTLTVSGFSMSGPGLLVRLTDFFARQSIAIDSISSSETEVTFTTYSVLDEYQKSELWRNLNITLGSEYAIDIRNNIGMIYCVGDHLSGHPGLLEKISGILAKEGIDIECITQSRGQRAVTIGVNSENLSRGVQILHQELIES